MKIYCDRLSFGSCAKAVQLSWRSLLSRDEVCTVELLDPPRKCGYTTLLRIIMQHLGFCVKEAEFFAGHLRKLDDEVVFSAARSVSNDMAFREAERVLMGSKFLTRLNQEWGRDTILMHIAKSLDMPALQVALRFMVAEALKERAAEKKVFLVVQSVFASSPDLANILNLGLKVYFYRAWPFQGRGSTFLSSGPYESLERSRGSVLLFLLFTKVREAIWSLKNMVGERTRALEVFNDSEVRRPSLLVLQEDDLSLDRSYRTQPHWLFREDGKPTFRTIVLQNPSAARTLSSREELEEQGVIVLSPRERHLLSRRFFPSHPVWKCLRRDLWSCAFASAFGSPVEVQSMFAVARLLYAAMSLIRFCGRCNIKSFITCENQRAEADAIQLIAPHLSITTLAYQYSNLGTVGPLMMTTADSMLTFSPLYHKRWARGGIHPKKFVDIGYTYDSSFKYIRHRARALREELEEAGAQFIICYFDENPLRDKYTLIGYEDHCAEILSLLKLLLEDSSLGLVVKTQFQRNSPQNFHQIAREVAEADATGRYVELMYGAHRNIVFPAEAALAADIAIGHAVGATAALEAAVVGVRCILLNPYGMRSANDSLYEQADIVYSSMDAALKAISQFRAGDIERNKLGDWSVIIGHFDPFRDGRAGHRVRKLLDEKVS
ncbi:MAG: hypothetical protein JRJ77_11095 [Deltaproteobacteria bacterium]|nr:hypothetical protein [Deltaproteobacteria bacterium]